MSVNALRGSSHTYLRRLSHLSFSTQSPFSVNPNCLFHTFYSVCHLLSLYFPSPLSSSFLPVCECCCFTLLLCGKDRRSPREAEERMYPRGLFGVLLSVDQHAPDGLTGSSMHSEALTGASGLFKTPVQSSTKNLAFQTLQ